MIQPSTCWVSNDSLQYIWLVKYEVYTSQMCKNTAEPLATDTLIGETAYA